MKFFFIITNGRSGSDFLHSLLNGHEEVASFPGFINLTKLEIEFKKFKSESDLIDKFIADYEIFFNSKLNKMENHHKLGQKKNQFYQVNKLKFKNYYFSIIKNNYNYSFKNFLINLHLSYYKASQKKNANYKKIKIILIQPKYFKFLDKIQNLDYKILYSYRHPISILNSGINAFFKNKKNKFSPSTLYFYLNRLLLEPFFLSKHKQLYVIRLEKLHLEPVKTLKKICKIMQIKFKKTLLISSFNGKLWWGDSCSKLKTSAFNETFKIKINVENFFYKDFFLIQFILNNGLKLLKYDKINYKKLNFLVNFLPLKIEYLIMKYSLQNFKILSFFFYLINYLRRVCLYNILYFKKCNLNKLEVI